MDTSNAPEMVVIDDVQYRPEDADAARARKAAADAGVTVILPIGVAQSGDTSPLDPPLPVRVVEPSAVTDEGEKPASEQDAPLLVAATEEAAPKKAASSRKSGDAS
jgi:hypothetical protein